MAEPQGTFSGGPIDDFGEGWACFMFVGQKAHYWIDDSDAFRSAFPDAPAERRGYVTLCGVVGITTPRVPPLHPGNYPLCKRCMAKAKRWTTKEERQTFLETVPGARELFR